MITHIFQISKREKFILSKRKKALKNWDSAYLQVPPNRSDILYAMETLLSIDRSIVRINYKLLNIKDLP